MPLTVWMEPRPRRLPSSLVVTCTLPRNPVSSPSPANVRFLPRSSSRSTESGRFDRACLCALPRLPAFDDDIVAERRAEIGLVFEMAFVGDERSVERDLLVLEREPFRSRRRRDARPADSARGISPRARSSARRRLRHRAVAVPVVASVPEAVKRPAPPASESSSSVIVPSASRALTRPSVKSTPYCGASMRIAPARTVPDNGARASVPLATSSARALPSTIAAVPSHGCSTFSVWRSAFSARRSGASGERCPGGASATTPIVSWASAFNPRCERNVAVASTASSREACGKLGGAHAKRAIAGARAGVGSEGQIALLATHRRPSR